VSVGIACRIVATCVDRSARWAGCCWHASLVDWCRRLLVFVGGRVGGCLVRGHRALRKVCHHHLEGAYTFKNSGGTWHLNLELEFGHCDVWSVSSSICSMLDGARMEERSRLISLSV